MHGKLELHRRWRTIWAWLMFDMAPKKYHSKTDNQLAGKEKYRPRKVFHLLYFYMRNLCDLICLEQWYFSLI